MNCKTIYSNQKPEPWPKTHVMDKFAFEDEIKKGTKIKKKKTYGKK